MIIHATAEALKERIAQNGIVISEYFPSSDPQAGKFLRLETV